MKKIVLLAFVLVLLSTAVVVRFAITVTASLPVHNIDTGLDYATIQEAINAPETLDGHTIRVDDGIYHEHVVISKSISLIGEDRSTTVIDGNGTWIAVALEGTNITFSGFTIENADVGVDLGGSNIFVIDINVDNCHLGILAEECFNCVISGNNVNNQTVKKGEYEDFGGGGIALDECVYCNVAGNNANNNELIGIWVRGGLNNIIENNANNNPRGVVLDEASNCTVAGNILSNNLRGIEFEPAHNCSIYANNIINNARGISPAGSNNSIYHNNFINNTEPVETGFLGYHTWDDGYPSGGNYWSDYEERYPNAVELDSSGIWDTPYVIDENNNDRYPLMNPYVDTTPPTISIISPENKTYPVNDVPLTFTLSETTSWIGYSLDGQANVTITGNTTLSGLSEGSHTLRVYAKDTVGNTGASEIIYFTVEPEKEEEAFPILIVVAIVTVAVVGAAIAAIFLWRRRK